MAAMTSGEKKQFQGNIKSQDFHLLKITETEISPGSVGHLATLLIKIVWRKPSRKV